MRKTSLSFMHPPLLPRTPHHENPTPPFHLIAASALAFLVMLPHAARAQQTLYVTVDDTSVVRSRPMARRARSSRSWAWGGVLALDAAGNLYVGIGSGSGVGGEVARFAPDGTRSSFASIVDSSELAAATASG